MAATTGATANAARSTATGSPAHRRTAAIDVAVDAILCVNSGRAAASAPNEHSHSLLRRDATRTPSGAACGYGRRRAGLALGAPRRFDVSLPAAGGVLERHSPDGGR